MKIDIAEGAFKDSTVWKNRTVSWDWFKKRCSETHRTSETMKQYLAESTKRQGDIKDCCGAFVGGLLTGKGRSKKDVINRTILVLDADYASKGFWDDYLMLQGHTSLIYSTHKHTPENPRIRLCIPFSRPVTPLEYEPIARMLAKKIGIEQIDPTTYDINRLMYYPSTSSDGEFIFDSYDGKLLEPEYFLNMYADYLDVNEWPTSSFEHKRLKNALSKKADPLTIPGIVGAYCRTYSIYEAVEDILSDVYVKSDIPDRYTFSGGSGSNGLFIYEGVFAQSFHSTDPAGGGLWNAFDLVRIHKFGHLDDNVTANTDFKNYPSIKKMEEFAREDKQVRRLLFDERASSSVKGDFEDGEDLTEIDNSWVTKLVIDRKGIPTADPGNLDLILLNDRSLKGKFGLNSFSGCIDVKGKLPWDEPRDKTRYNRTWDEFDFQYLRGFVGSSPYFIKSSDMVKDAFGRAALINSYHPVKEYLNGLNWDGVKRIDNLLHYYYGSEDTELNRAFTRKWICGAVARIFNPGVKFDTVLVLVGLEGKGKSTFFKKLGRQWFSDSFNFGMLSQGVRAYEQIQNKWIIEIPEMAGLRKADVEAAKSFIASSEDYYRSAYKASADIKARQCIFGGSSNKQEFLISKTGDRRFWPVDVGVVEPVKSIFDSDSMDSEEIDQIWAEAVQLLKDGEKLYLSDKLEKEAKLSQLAHSDSDDNSYAIDKFLNTPVPEGWYDKSIKDRITYADFADSGSLRDRVCATEIAMEALGYSSKELHLNKNIIKGIHDYMRNQPDWVEYKSKARFGEYGVLKGYFRKT